MKLNYQIFPEGAEVNNHLTPLLIVPGLFGSISNWRSIAKQLSNSRTVIVVDQRNHGRSPHAESQSYADMVSDLVELCRDLQLASVDVAGHSMGGKVAMLLAVHHPDLLRSLVILDIAPVTYSHSHAPFLKALLDIDLSTLESRGGADRALRDAIPDTSTRLFLLQSLTGSPGNYKWRLNLKVLHDYMDEIIGFPDIDIHSEVDTLIIAGADSTYLLSEHHARLSELFPRSKFASVANAGHWLHAEQPEAVIKLMENFLQK